MIHIHNKSKSPSSDKKEQHIDLSNPGGGETHIHIHMDSQSSTQQNNTLQIEQKLQSLTAITEKLTQSLSLLAGKSIYHPVPLQNVNDLSVKKSSTSLKNNFNDKSVNFLDKLPKKRFSSNFDSKLQNSTNVKKISTFSEVLKDDKIKRKRGRPQKSNQSHDDQYSSKDNLLPKVKRGLMTTRSKSKINEKEVELYDETQNSHQSHGPVNQNQTRTKRKYTRRSETLAKSKTIYQQNSQPSQDVQIEKQDKKSQKLKRPPNAYQYFVKEKMPNVMKDNKLSSIAEGSKVISQMWSSMTEKQKSFYFDKVLNERLDLQLEMVSFPKEKEEPNQKLRNPKKVKFDEAKKPELLDIKHSGKIEQSIQSKLEGILGKRLHDYSRQSNLRDQNDKISKCQKGGDLTQVPHVNEEMYNALTQDSSVTELFDQNTYASKNQKIKDELKNQNSIISSSMDDGKMSIGKSDEANYINLFQK